MSSDDRRAREGSGPVPRPSSTGDRLISDLRAGACEGEPGQHTLDGAKAQEELEQFQLRDPWSHVLELVQAAVLKGATAIDVQIDARHLALRFDGEPFAPTELETARSVLLGHQVTPALQALARLALAVSALRRLRPLRLEVRSGDGTTASRLLVSAGGDRCEPMKGHPGGTEVLVEHRRGARKQAVSPGRGASRFTDEQYLRERCRFSDVPITVNGTPVAEGLSLGDGLGVVPFEGDGFAGVAGYVPDLRQSVLHMVKDGVLLASARLDTPAPGYVAVVSSSGFRMDLSRSTVIEDDLWRAASERAVAMLPEVLGALEKERSLQRWESLELAGWNERTLARARGDAADQWKADREPLIPVTVPRRIEEPSLIRHLYDCLASHNRIAGSIPGDLLLSDEVQAFLFVTPPLVLGAVVPYLPEVARLVWHGGLQAIWGSAHALIALFVCLAVLDVGVVLLLFLGAWPKVRDERRALERGVAVPETVTRLHVVFGPVPAEGRHLCALPEVAGARAAPERWGAPKPDTDPRHRRVTLWMMAGALLLGFVVACLLSLTCDPTAGHVVVP